MASEQEILNLIYEYHGAEALKQATQDLHDAQAATKALGDQFRQGVIDEATFRESIRFQARTIADSRERIEGLQRAARGLGQGTGELGQRFTALSYAIQDFASTSGDLGQKLNSISNNLPGIAAGMNKWVVAAAALAPVLIAIYRNWEDIARAFESKNPFPQSAEDIGRLTRELDKAKEAMGKLEGYSSLTNTELARYNSLRTRTAELEKQIADQQERQANYTKAMRSTPPDVEERRTGVQGAVAGYGPQFERDLALAIAGRGPQERLEQFRQQRDRQIAETREKIAPEYQEQAIATIEAEYRRREQGLIDGFDALAKVLMKELTDGSKAAHDRVEALIRANVKVFQENLGPETIAKFFEGTPEATKEAEHTRDVMEEAAEAHRQNQAIARETQDIRLRQRMGFVVSGRHEPLPPPDVGDGGGGIGAGGAGAAVGGGVGGAQMGGGGFAVPGPIIIGPGQGPAPFEAFAMPIPARPGRLPPPQTAGERVSRARQRRAQAATARRARQEMLRQQRAAEKQRAQQRYLQSRVGRAEQIPQPLDADAGRSAAGLGRPAPAQERAAILAAQRRRAQESRTGQAATAARVRQEMAQQMGAAEADRQGVVARLARERAEQIEADRERPRAGVPGPRPIPYSQAHPATTLPRGARTPAEAIAQANGQAIGGLARVGGTNISNTGRLIGVAGQLANHTGQLLSTVQLQAARIGQLEAMVGARTKPAGRRAR
jgi:hypothetical protein